MKLTSNEVYFNGDKALFLLVFYDDSQELRQFNGLIGIDDCAPEFSGILGNGDGL